MIGNAIETARLLVVSRDFEVLRVLRSLGEANDWQLESIPNLPEVMERVQSGMTPDLLLLDLSNGHADGLNILRLLSRLCPSLPIVLLGHAEDGGKRQEAIRMGAKDYVARPVDDRRLETVIRRHLLAAREAVETDITSDNVELISDGTFFIGISPIMRRVRAQAAFLAEANVPVLILGEGGSGKETIARLIHKLSVRSGAEFAKVNCAALPSEMLESELFGRKRIGAAARVRTQAGKMELCVKGTILLDEITEMPMRVQANLLQVLQSKRFTRPGTGSSIEVDVRVLGASTTNREHAISKSRLREDLYYHLSASTIHVPPLRERKEDLPLLLHHLMNQLAKYYGVPPRDFSPAMIESCRAYSWPGNLRELEDLVKRYLVAGDKDLPFGKIPCDLNDVVQDAAPEVPRNSNTWPPLTMPHCDHAGSDSLKSLVRNVRFEAEKNAIAAALQKTGWNRKAAARLLEISYRTLLYKIEHYQMRSSSDSSPFPGSNSMRSRGAGFRGNGRTD